MSRWFDRIWDPVGLGGCTRECCAIFYARSSIARMRYWKDPYVVLVGPGDLFGTHVRDDVIKDIYMIMAKMPQHRFRVLVRNIYKMEQWFGTYECMSLQEHFAMDDMEWPPPNIELGVVVVDELTGSERIGTLVATPAATRFVVIDRLQTAIDLTDIECPSGAYDQDQARSCTLCAGGEQNVCRDGRYNCLAEGIDTVILADAVMGRGPEMEPAWRGEIVTQCELHGVQVIRPTLRSP